MKYFIKTQNLQVSFLNDFVDGKCGPEKRGFQHLIIVWIKRVSTRKVTYRNGGVVDHRIKN